MNQVKKSHKLDGVCYDIRGPVLKQAQKLEEEGYKILRLNTGNPGAFGLHAPDEILRDMIINLPNADAYSDSKGLFFARKAVMQYCQQKEIAGVEIEDIYLGNGASELIQMSMQALLNNGNEILIPMPDYPLWTASVTLSGGKAVHYVCDESSDWMPDVRDIEKKITPRTKGIVIINPNNPTGAVYPRAVLEQIIEIARKHDLIIFSDEIYDKILYDDAEHYSMASLADDVLFVTFNGLSKAYRACGFRGGWMVISGNKKIARDYVEGITLLASMRLCSNVPAQFAIQTALGGYQSIYDLTKPGGRLYEQRRISIERLNQIPGVSCVKPMGALYCFPKVDVKKFHVKNDEKLMLDLLEQERILLVQGTGFNWPAPDHFRLIFLPTVGELAEAFDKMERFFAGYRQSPAT